MSQSATFAARAETEIRPVDRLIASFCILGGALLVYATLFDNGPLVELVTGGTASNLTVIHELFHDGRHLTAVPCH
jgi:hypothetical protein